jgi:hypothetical protein
MEVLRMFGEVDATALVSIQPPLVIAVPADAKLLRVFDADTFAAIETILINSPRTNPERIVIKLERGYLGIRPLRCGVYWIREIRPDFKLGLPIDPRPFENRLLLALDGI